MNNTYNANKWCERSYGMLSQLTFRGLFVGNVIIYHLIPYYIHLNIIPHLKPILASSQELASSQVQINTKNVVEIILMVLHFLHFKKFLGFFYSSLVPRYLSKLHSKDNFALFQ